MSVRVPTASTAPWFLQTTDLGESLYRLEFQYNTRDGAWYLSVSSQAGTELVMGRKLRLDTDWLRQFSTRAGLPAGVLQAPDRDGTFAEPGRDDLGARVEVEFEAA